MRINLQDHMERVNRLILRYKDEWRNDLPLLYKRLLNDSNVIIVKAVATKKNEVVGMMVGTIQEHPRFTIERSVKIDDVWVDTDHRQRGICSQLLSHLQERIAENGIKHFTLNYVVNNNEAEQTWRALGFTPIITNCAAKMKD
jgi:ribosomal protein S18 acetylase RimI-like enzyme